VYGSEFGENVIVNANREENVFVFLVFAVERALNFAQNGFALERVLG